MYSVRERMSICMRFKNMDRVDPCQAIRGRGQRRRNAGPASSDAGPTLRRRCPSNLSGVLADSSLLHVTGPSTVSVWRRRA